MEPTEQLSILLPILTNIVGRIEPNQLDDPTPCAAFTVRDVVNHMINGAESFAPAFRGTEPTPSAPIPVGVHPAARFRTAMAELLNAVHSPGALTRVVDAPFGQVPGEVFARFVAFDGLVHGWDMASSTGQPYAPPAELTASVDGFARQALSPDMRDGDTFAAETAARPEDDDLLRLIAFSGRTVGSAAR